MTLLLVYRKKVQTESQLIDVTLVFGRKKIEVKKWDRKLF
jgi:hypothetical protein